MRLKLCNSGMRQFGNKYSFGKECSRAQRASVLVQHSDNGIRLELTRLERSDGNLTAVSRLAPFKSCNASISRVRSHCETDFN